ncbi:hypothetical protein BGZ65_002489 [Modicella reniformis]|uniref:MYND-type domain-containing protein n=1 Tax=Modicella reniformis TaxID=1440133 RepID=A0A9P6MIZ9_9FUNG|nr:hypothetical protein BGZ65_002489 [Modicella reniformis]
MVNKPPCLVCKTPSTTRCSRCKVAHYCSEACQLKNWPTHKIACTPSTAPSTVKSTTASTTSTATDINSTSNSGRTVPDGTPTLPDPNEVLNVRPVDPHTPNYPPLRKVPPQGWSTSLKFEYQPSADGVDENLVLFLHGLGDKIKPNFVRLSQSLQLPQSATCCIQAPTPIPYLELEGWQWFPSFSNLSGELLGPESPERMLQITQLTRPQLVKFVRHCIDHCGFDSRKIILFGFSQGGEVALDLAAFGNLNLRAVISLGGYLMVESQTSEPVGKLNTCVMVVQGDKDKQRSVKEAKDRFKYIQRMFGKDNAEHSIVEGMGHEMPNNEAGWRPLMKFFARNLDRRETGLENMPDVFEVTP